MVTTRTDAKPPKVAATTDSSHIATAERLSADELRKLDAYWRACKYLAAGMIYLRANPLLREPLRTEHVKLRLLGHWGSSPGLSFAYIHLNRLIKKYDLDAIFLAGPGHGAPGVLAPTYLEGTYSEIYPHKGEDEEGQKRRLHVGIPFRSRFSITSAKRSISPSVVYTLGVMRIPWNSS